MAQTNNTVDPNDLDSIDALLDEAELESVTEVAESEQSSSSSGGADDVVSTDAEEVPENWATEEDPTAGLLDELDGDLGAPSLEAEEASKPELKSDESPQTPEAVAKVPETDTLSAMQGGGAAGAMEHKAEDILEKRAQAQKANNVSKGPNMDAIKKLIITFSSIIIFLVVATLGVGIWAALSSGGDLNQETMDKINGIEANSIQSLMHSNASDKTLKTLDKKLDAISFQLEQLNGDLAKIEASSLQKAANEKSGHENAQAAAKSSDATPAAAPIQEIKAAPELTAKLDRVGAQMTSAQRRIYEINQRVKKLQSDYKLLLKSIKSVEKQLVSKKIEEAPVTASKKGGAKTSGGHGSNAQSAVKPHAPVTEPNEPPPVQSSPYQYPPSGGYKDNGAYTY